MIEGQNIALEDNLLIEAHSYVKRVHMYKD
jgi:hypothetical protein